MRRSKVIVMDFLDFLKLIMGWGARHSVGGNLGRLGLVAGCRGGGKGGEGLVNFFSGNRFLFVDCMFVIYYFSS